ncbi:Hypothetical protein PHPALM_14388 [Phytophthora palmivora]|uniref:Uncharacterized protein n=1 Tax=Phytophthora palmivora TaxID=4796 RepID=A0A2P4XUY6_9STRA|nr:Hypothetical protein PHPALM_14388 [Phytophthora palmivora]
MFTKDVRLSVYRYHDTIYNRTSASLAGRLPFKYGNFSKRFKFPHVILPAIRSTTMVSQPIKLNMQKRMRPKYA